MSGNKPLAVTVVSAIIFLLVTTTAYYKRNGLKDLKRLQTAITDIESEILAVRLTNERYRRELDSLNHSNAYVEAIARENLGLVKPGEVVYEFVDAEALAGSTNSLGLSTGKKGKKSD